MHLGPLRRNPSGKPPGLALGYASLPRHLFSAALVALADILTDQVSSLRLTESVLRLNSDEVDMIHFVRSYRPIDCRTEARE